MAGLWHQQRRVHLGKKGRRQRRRRTPVKGRRAHDRVDRGGVGALRLVAGIGQQSQPLSRQDLLLGDAEDGEERALPTFGNFARGCGGGINLANQVGKLTLPRRHQVEHVAGRRGGKGQGRRNVQRYDAPVGDRAAGEQAQARMAQHAVGYDEGLPGIGVGGKLLGDVARNVAFDGALRPALERIELGDELHGAEAERQQQHDPGRGDEPRRPHDAAPCLHQRRQQAVERQRGGGQQQRQQCQEQRSRRRNAQIGATERRADRQQSGSEQQRGRLAHVASERAQPHDHQGRGQRREQPGQRKRAVHGQVGPQQRAGQCDGVVEPGDIGSAGREEPAATPPSHDRGRSHAQRAGKPACQRRQPRLSAPAPEPGPHAQGNDGGAPQQHGWAQQWHVGKEQAKRQPGRRPPAQVGMGQRLQAEPERKRHQQRGLHPAVGGARRPDVPRAQRDEEQRRRYESRARQSPRHAGKKHYGKEAHRGSGEAQAQHAGAGEAVDQAGDSFKEVERTGLRKGERLAIDQAQAVDALAGRTAGRRAGEVPHAQQQRQREHGDHRQRHPPRRGNGGGAVAVYSLVGRGDAHEVPVGVLLPAIGRQVVVGRGAGPPRAGHDQHHAQPPDERGDEMGQPANVEAGADAAGHQAD